MPRFRNQTPPSELGGTPAALPTPDQIRCLAADALRPAHFFLTPGLTLALNHTEPEVISWEVLHGRLLDPAHTNRRQDFETWNLFLIGDHGPLPEPLLSLKLDASAGELHVVRALECYAWEAYEAGERVFLTREVRKWVRELTGTIRLAQFSNGEDLRDEIICRLFLAVVGTRLPLTSVESPLPGFSLGRLAYFYRPGLDESATPAGPLRSYRDLIEKALGDHLAWVEKARLLETLLHAVPTEELAEAVELFLVRWCGLRRSTDVREQEAPRDLVELLLTMFNEASLSPDTGLVDWTLAFVHVLEAQGHWTPPDVADFFSRLLRQLVRHLTAYDLVTFHHRGANYPDALLLDAALKAYLELMERQPALFLPAAGDGEAGTTVKRLRRRALRQGWLLRRRYEGHLVPDAPTSQGENARVLPPPHVRVPDEQIANPHRRSKRLYDGDPLDRYLGDPARSILGQSIADLHHPLELRELGMAIFLARPLDAGKHTLEPDQTPLLSYLAFSRSIALRRLNFLALDLGLLPQRAEHDAHRQYLEKELDVRGVPVDAVSGTRRAGAVSLADAGRVADDFVFLRTTSRSRAEFWSQYRATTRLQALGVADFQDLVLIVRTGPVQGGGDNGLAVYDRLLRKRLELDFDPGPGYASRGGVEFPLGPLRVLRAWEETDPAAPLREHDLRADPILLPPPQEFRGS
jgi:hypothetical protein